MAWDVEGTKRKILDAAVAEFAQFGPDATTIERIAKSAGVNKERVYNYFGDKRTLFAAVLRSELAKVALAAKSSTEEDIGDYAGRVFDYHCEHPELSRLLHWEGLILARDVPDEAVRRDYYAHKTKSLDDAQRRGAVTTALDADHLTFLVLALAGWWFAVPQIARMLSGADDEEELARRRASVVEAARRLAKVP